MKVPKLQACGNTMVCGSVGGGTLLFLTDRPEYFQRCTSTVDKHTFSHHMAWDADFSWRWIRLIVWLAAFHLNLNVLIWLCALHRLLVSHCSVDNDVAEIQTGRCGLDYQYFTAEIEHCTTATTAGKNTANVTGKGAFMWFHITASYNTSTTITTSAVSSAASSDPPPGQLGCIWSITLSLPMSSADISRRYCKPEDYLNFN